MERGGKGRKGVEQRGSYMDGGDDGELCSVPDLRKHILGFLLEPVLSFRRGRESSLAGELEVEKRSFCTLFATHSPSSPAPLCFFPRETLHLDRGDIIAGWRRSTIQVWRVGFRGQLSPHDRPTAQPLSQNKDVYFQGLEAPIRTSPAYCGRRMN